ncbi:hypothetical protein B0T11DRAFT_286151 [Plectosphaerella cucumerina]|uniref:F-box domain-containing protein n=1 Tax=Plectosphaerella cucumerina TaxID=40658 RepID=A0A8K0TCB2_9PEZI|nr:hypothetical protein B0T11DRAFT_286151 [Plectosphaerella cucumerina]
MHLQWPGGIEVAVLVVLPPSMKIQTTCKPSAPRSSTKAACALSQRIAPLFYSANNLSVPASRHTLLVFSVTVTALRSQTIPVDMASWNTIPTELRLAILDIVFFACTNDDVLWNSKRLGSYMNPKPGRRRHKSSRIKSLLSTVCREWQQYFEKRNFHDLVLTQSDLWSFLTMIKQTPMYRLAYVKRIHFKVLLEEYDCNSCMTKEEESTIQRNCAIFTYAIWYLLSTLFQSTRPVVAKDQAKIQLQISVFSPSDNHHCFWNWCLKDEYYFSTPIVGGPEDETTGSRTTFWNSPFISSPEIGTHLALLIIGIMSGIIAPSSTQKTDFLQLILTTAGIRTRSIGFLGRDLSPSIFQCSLGWEQGLQCACPQ